MTWSIDQRLDEAKRAKSDIDKIENFLLFIAKKNKYDEKNSSINEFKGFNKYISCSLEAYISTGSQSPRRSVTLEGDNLVDIFINKGLAGLREELEKKYNRLEKLFNIQ